LEPDYRQNKSPFAIALGDWFLLRIYFLTSKASPNDSEIVIVVIIIVICEADLVFHIGGIIAQTDYLARVSFASTRYGKSYAGSCHEPPKIWWQCKAANQHGLL
jgi:hypothetical protein